MHVHGGCQVWPADHHQRELASGAQWPGISRRAVVCYIQVGVSTACCCTAVPASQAVIFLLCLSDGLLCLWFNASTVPTSLHLLPCSCPGCIKDATCCHLLTVPAGSHLTMCMTRTAANRRCITNQHGHWCCQRCRCCAMLARAAPAISAPVQQAASCWRYKRSAGALSRLTAAQQQCQAWGRHAYQLMSPSSSSVPHLVAATGQ